MIGRSAPLCRMACNTGILPVSSNGASCLVANEQAGSLSYFGCGVAALGRSTVAPPSVTLYAAAALARESIFARPAPAAFLLFQAERARQCRAQCSTARRKSDFHRPKLSFT